MKFQSLVYIIFTAFSALASLNAQPLLSRSVLFNPPVNSYVKMNHKGTHLAFLHSSENDRVLKVKNLTNPDEDISFNVNMDGFQYEWTYLNTILIHMRVDNQYEIIHLDILNGESKSIATRNHAVRILPLSQKRQKEFLVLSANPDTLNAGIFLTNLEKSNSEKIYSIDGFSNMYFDSNFKRLAGIKANQQFGHDLLVAENDHTFKILRSYPFDATYLVGNPVNAVCGISLNGEELYFTDNLETDKAVFCSYSFMSDSIAILAEDSEADLISSSTVFDGRNFKPASIAALFGKSKRTFLNDEHLKVYNALLTFRSGDPGFINCSIDGKFYLIRYMDGGPPMYFYYDSRANSLKHVLSEYPQMDSMSFSTRTAFYVHTTDSLTLPCQLYLPAGIGVDQNGFPDKPLPTILYVHGGPWIGLYQNNWLINRHLQLLANRGYAVINTEFRGATGYGKLFQSKSHGEFGGAMHRDLIDIVDYAVNHGISIKEKVGIFGWSYGGYAAAYSMGKSPDLFSCGLNLYGVNDLVSFVRTPLWSAWVGNPGTSEGRNLIESHSPLSWVKDIKNPMLVSHGGKDTRVLPEQSEVFVQAMVDQNKKVIYTFYPEEGHDFMLERTWKSFWAYSELFLRETLGGKVEVVGKDMDDPGLEWKAGKQLIKW